MQNARFTLSVLISSILMFCCVSSVASNILDNEPIIVIHDTIASPGDLLLRIDALNFTEDHGEVAALTIRIEVDTFLIKFIDIQNMSLAGGWLANYNFIQNEITIIYNAPFGEGYDINGKLLDLHIMYSGGYSADLIFKAGCEVTNVNLQTIQGVIYEGGIINQTSSLGSVSLDSVTGFLNQSFNMPIMAQGIGYDMINRISLRVNYDSNQMEYIGFNESVLSNVSVHDSNSILTIDWEDNISPIDFTSLDTLIFLQFSFIGDSNSLIKLLPGSIMFNNDVLVASDFYNGIVMAKWAVELNSIPVYAGTTTGDGYYFDGKEVTAIAIPNEGFRFVVWTEEGEVVSVDSAYSFIAHSNRSLTANFQYYSECSAPVGLYADELSETNALLHWISSGSEDDWNLLWGEMGFDTINGGILIEGLNETQYLLEDLDSGISYDFYVRAVCTDDIHSSWSGPYTFQTWFVGTWFEPYGKSILVFPNPTNYKLNIRFIENIPSGTKYQILNSSGLLSITGDIFGLDYFSIDVNSLSTGIYVIQIYNEDVIISEKFVIK